MTDNLRESRLVDLGLVTHKLANYNLQVGILLLHLLVYLQNQRVNFSNVTIHAQRKLLCNYSFWDRVLERVTGNHLEKPAGRLQILRFVSGDGILVAWIDYPGAKSDEVIYRDEILLRRIELLHNF